MSAKTQTVITCRSPTAAAMKKKLSLPLIYLSIIVIVSLFLHTTKYCDASTTTNIRKVGVGNNFPGDRLRLRLRLPSNIVKPPSTPTAPSSPSPNMKRDRWRYRRLVNVDTPAQNRPEHPLSSFSYPTIISLPMIELPNREMVLGLGKVLWDNGSSIISMPWKFLRHSILFRPLSSASMTGSVTLIGVLGYALIRGNRIRGRRRNGNQPEYDHSQQRDDKMKTSQIISRVFLFWTAAAPILLHYRFTQVWVDKIMKYDKGRRDDIYQNLHEMHAPRAQDVVLSLRGLFIKVAQVVSSRPDFMPHEYIEVFASLQDNVPPYPGHEMKEIITKSLREIHGLDFDDIFDDFDHQPLGSASIGQVHAATLTPQFLQKIRHQQQQTQQQSRYSAGPNVALKVMHFDARQRFTNDFRILKCFCRIALPGWKPLLAEIERQMMTEFDYRREAESLRIVRQNMAESAYAKRIVVPDVIEEYSTVNVLIMEMVRGEKLAKDTERKLASILDGGGDGDALARGIIAQKRKELTVGTASEPIDTPLKLYRFVQAQLPSRSIFYQMFVTMQISMLIREQREINDLILDVHGHQIFINGCFNGDPHPGNILKLEDGRICLIDYGQCKKLSDDERLGLSKIVETLASFDEDDGGTLKVVDAMHKFGFRFKYGKEDIITQMAFFCFDSDIVGKALGCATPQDYLQYLQSCDPLEHVPDAAVFVARTSFLFRGMGALLGQHIYTSQKWAKHAKSAILSSAQSPG